MIESKVKRGRKETADMSLRAFIDFCFSPVSSWKASTISYFLKKKKSWSGEKMSILFLNKWKKNFRIFL